MNLTESVKSFLRPIKRKNPSSVVNPEKVISNLTDDGCAKQSDFFDYQEDHYTNIFGRYTLEEIVQKQAEKIRSYRRAAMFSEVSEALDIIVNEVIFTYEDQPLKLDVNISNEQIKDALQQCFDKIIKITDLNVNIFEIVKNAYVDGQIILHCEYNEKNQKKGIQKVRIIDPVGIYYDEKEKLWKYLEAYNSSIYYTNSRENEKYSNEEIVRVDFGLYDDFVCLSYLEQAIKNANMLRSLEDLLIPLRFSRSVSRRVFNVDVGNLPEKRAKEAMDKIQQKFKYKKFYNNDTGEVSNQQHITSMVEDYWFSNRSGSKGTTVDTLDETGNLGELEDIIYIAKKLYRSLKIPTSRLDIDPDSDHSFSFDATETTQEDIKFMNFISRVRKVFIKLIKELLRRQVISMGILTDKEWDKLNRNIDVQFTNENLFIEKLKNELFKSKVENWNDMKDIGGTVLPFRDVMKRVFNLTDEEIDNNLNAIEREKKSKKFDIFYQLADIELASETGMSGMTDAEGNPMDAKDLSLGVFTDEDDFEDDEEGDNSSEGEEKTTISDYFTKYKLQ